MQSAIDTVKVSTVKAQSSSDSKGRPQEADH